MGGRDWFSARARAEARRGGLVWTLGMGGVDGRGSGCGRTVLRGQMRGVEKRKREEKFAVAPRSNWNQRGPATVSPESGPSKQTGDGLIRVPARATEFLALPSCLLTAPSNRNSSNLNPTSNTTRNRSKKLTAQAKGVDSYENPSWGFYFGVRTRGVPWRVITRANRPQNLGRRRPWPLNHGGHWGSWQWKRGE